MRARRALVLGAALAVGACRRGAEEVATPAATEATPTAAPGDAPSEGRRAAAAVVAAPPVTRRRHVPTVDEVCAQIMALAGIDAPQENPENWAICLEEVRDMRAACTEESWAQVGSCVLFAADVGALAACDRQELCVLREDAPPPAPMPVPPPPKRDPADASEADAAHACEAMVDLVLREDGKEPQEVAAAKRGAAVDACLDSFATPEFLRHPPETRRRIFACIRAAKSMKDAGLCAVPPPE